LLGQDALTDYALRRQRGAQLMSRIADEAVLPHDDLLQVG
jgi:hypothetical protein